MAKATQKFKVKETERKSFLTANIESTLHRQITQEAARNKFSFSAQTQEYKDKSIALEGTVAELRAANRDLLKELEREREEIKKITDVN